MCSLLLSLGSVAVQNRASKMSWPNEENSLSAIYKSAREQNAIKREEVEKRKTRREGQREETKIDRRKAWFWESVQGREWRERRGMWNGKGM